MKTIISAIFVAGALSQMASAMGPMGDTTHRHFYKEQEWIWQKEDSRAKAKIRTDESQSFTGGHVWNVPVASGLPKNLSSPAFGLPNTLPMASVLPTHPRTASVLP